MAEETTSNLPAQGTVPNDSPQSPCVPSGGIEWYQQRINIRGCELRLADIKAACRELSKVIRREGERIIAGFTKPEDVSEEKFASDNQMLLDDAFRLTISVVGFSGTTAYGEDETVFDSSNLPIPIRTIFFTNENAYRRNANNQLPDNRFSIWINFEKPPLIDATSLLSAPTPNESNISIHATDVAFHRAVRDIIRSTLFAKNKWYAFIHRQFVYDIGLWFFAIPYILFSATMFVYSNIMLQEEFSEFRIAVGDYPLEASESDR